LVREQGQVKFGDAVGRRVAEKEVIAESVANARLIKGWKKGIINTLRGGGPRWRRREVSKGR